MTVLLEGDFELTHSIILLIKKQLMYFYIRYHESNFIVISTAFYSSTETNGIIKTPRIYLIVFAETRTIQIPYNLK